jgi:hypothetical protein
LAVERPPGATATLADVQGYFVAERDWLEGAIVVETLASIARIATTMRRDMVALHFPDLSHACWSCAL